MYGGKGGLGGCCPPPRTTLNNGVEKMPRGRHSKVINLGVVKRHLSEYHEDTRTLIITIPMAPISINTMYSIYHGRKLLTKSGRAWRERIDPILSAIKPSYTERVSVSIEVWPKTTRAFDIDNCAKAILDALQRNLIIKDDNQVWWLQMVKHEKDPDKPPGEIWVDISPLEL